MTAKARVASVATTIAMWLLSLTVLVPVVIVFLNSLKSQGEADLMNFALPAMWRFENFVTVIERGRILQSYMNSLIMSLTSGATLLLISSLSAFVLSRDKSRLHRGILAFFLVGLFAPLNMAPVFSTIRALGLINTRMGVVMMFIAVLIPFSTFLFYNFVDKIPRELDEAAIIDGCGPFRTFWSVLLPLLKPVSVTVLILNLVGTWNDFMIPLYLLYDSAKWPITLTIYDFLGRFSRDWSLVSANIVLTILPVLIMYVLGQSYIIKGMVSGSIKG